jgi:hypothetical protein
LEEGTVKRNKKNPSTPTTNRVTRAMFWFPPTLHINTERCFLSPNGTMSTRNKEPQKQMPYFRVPRPQRWRESLRAHLHSPGDWLWTLMRFL